MAPAPASKKSGEPVAPLHSEGSGRSSIFGRPGQVTDIRNLLEKITGGTGGVLLFSGESGVGKTRLLQEAEDRARDSGLSALSTSCYVQNREAPYAPWVEIIHQCVRSTARDEVFRASRPHMGALGQLDPELNDRIWLFDPAAHQGQQDRRAFLESVAGFFLDLSESRPLLISIDDLQWADAASLELLETLARVIKGSALGVVGAYRDDPGREESARPRPALKFAVSPSVSTRVLKPLDRASADQMVRAGLGRATVSDAVMGEIFGKTEGNPLYITELVRWLVEFGGVSSVSGAAASISTIELPASVERAIEARLGRVADDGTRSVASPERIAVLPFSSMSPDPNDGYLADGLTEELTNTLSRITGIRVIARTSVMRYKHTSKSVAQIGEELGVGLLIEGSVRKSGARVRVTLQCVNVTTEEHLWSENYDGQLSDLFRIQTEVAQRTASALKIGLGRNEKAALQRPPAAVPEAYELFLKGAASFRTSTVPGEADSIHYLSKSIQLDPKFAPALSYLANVLLIEMGSTISPADVITKIRDLLSRALAADPNSSDAHTARGNLAMQADLDWSFAASEFERALAINPSDAVAHFWYAHLLDSLQKPDQAMEHMRAASNLDPGWVEPRRFVSLFHERSGKAEAAIAVLKRDIEDGWDVPHSHLRLAQLYARLGRRDEARKEAHLIRDWRNEDYRIGRALLQAALGDDGSARRLLEGRPGDSEIGYISPAWKAALAAAIGERDEAFRLLARAQREGDYTLAFWYSASGFDSIRRDSRFIQLLESMKLPTTTPWELALGRDA